MLRSGRVNGPAPELRGLGSARRRQHPRVYSRTVTPASRSHRAGTRLRRGRGSALHTDWVMRKAAIGSLLLTVGLGTVGGLMFLAAFQFRLEWFADPAPLVAAGPTAAELLRWAAIIDLFSYYLATAVVAYVLWTALRSRGPALADLSTLAALGYVVAGGASAAVLAMVGPMLMYEHVRAGADQAGVALAFGVLVEVVFRAIWQFLDGYLLASWWLGVGLLLLVDQPRLARLSLILSAVVAIGGLFTALDFDVARYAALVVVFALWTTWSIWLIILLWQRLPPFALLPGGGTGRQSSRVREDR